MAAGKQNLVGSRVRRIRTAGGMSQEILVAKCGAAGWDISRGTFAKIESGLRRVNDAELVILAKVLACSLDDLLGGHPGKAVVVVVRQGREGV